MYKFTFHIIFKDGGTSAKLSMVVKECTYDSIFDKLKSNGIDINYIEKLKILKRERVII